MPKATVVKPINFREGGKVACPRRGQRLFAQAKARRQRGRHHRKVTSLRSTILASCHLS